MSSMIPADDWVDAMFKDAMEKFQNYFEEKEMSNLHVISAFQVRQAVDVVTDLIALNDPSDYLKREAMEVLESLKDSETIDSADYLKLNEENENENP